LGLGYTTSRLALRLLCRDVSVIGVARDLGRYARLGAAGVQLTPYEGPSVPSGATIVHTIPPLEGEEREYLRGLLIQARPSRVIYISSTSAYGERAFVDETHDAAPSEAKGLARADEEWWLRAQGWRTLVLRPAAIYGPGRGAHMRILEGKPPRTSGGTVISRIHADDLAMLLEAAVFSELEGTFPCADERPCSADEVSRWCEELLGVPRMTAPSQPALAGRSVDGRKVCELLGVQLHYPDYQAGILACLAGSH
jgi:nucleoside-diphosphate-sugar epimerase